MSDGVYVGHLASHSRHGCLVRALPSQVPGGVDLRAATVEESQRGVPSWEAWARLEIRGPPRPTSGRPLALTMPSR